MTLKSTPRRARRHLGNIIPGVFTPVLAKHFKNFSLVGAVPVCVDRISVGANF
jgi:hypothetical protein